MSGVERSRKTRTPEVRGAIPDSSCSAQMPARCRVASDIHAGDGPGFTGTAPELSLLWSPPSHHVQAASAHPQRESGGVRLHVGLERDVCLPGGVPALPARGAHL